MSDEHGWPHLFGEFAGFSHLLTHVCKDCNNKLGLLEDQFAHTGDIAVMRRRLNIEGRKGHDPIDPFVRGSVGATPMKAPVWDPQSGLNLLATLEPGLEGGAIHAHWLNQVIPVKSDGSETPIVLGDNVRTLGSIVDLLERFGVYPPARVRWLLFGELRSIIHSAIQASSRGYVWEELQEPGRVVQNGEEFVSSISKERFYIYRAIAKIALHYFLASSNGSSSGLEPYFGDVKDYIRNGGDDSQFVTMRWEPILQMPPHYGPTSWYHLATADYRGGLLFVSLQFFCGPQYPHPPRYDVALALTYDVTPDFSRHGHQFVYGNCEKGTGGYVGRAEPLHTSIPPGLDAGVCD